MPSRPLAFALKNGLRQAFGGPFPRDRIGEAGDARVPVCALPDWCRGGQRRQKAGELHSDRTGPLSVQAELRSDHRPRLNAAAQRAKMPVFWCAATKFVPFLHGRS